jgi:hypothetical protein
MGICNCHGLVEPYQLAVADMYVIMVDGAMMYIMLQVNKDLLLDGCNALQGLDACLQFLLLVVMVLADPRPSFILTSLDL